MKRIPSTCPVCQNTLHICALECPECGLELRNSFPLSDFDRLSAAQYSFLMAFLKHRGNLKNLQSELNISYPLAKKRLDELLCSLGLGEEPQQPAPPEVIDMRNLFFNRQSSAASDIIKAKLADNGGHATVHTLQGLPCEIWADADGKSFVCDKLPIKPNYEYATFDVIVDLLRSQNGSARKGNGRNYKLGDPECDETTVVGAIAAYRGYHNGESVFDPVFVMAAVLEWAGIAHNRRGYLELTRQYR